jgi:transglutaminase-like putative cysteine protease
MPLRRYVDLYGNPCTRVMLREGRSSFRYEAEIDVPDATEEADESAREIALDNLPDDTLIFILPSRYCLPGVLGDEPWTRFGSHPPGFRRVQAICDHVNSHLTFSYGGSSSRSTASDVNSTRLGLCRDFTIWRLRSAGRSTSPPGTPSATCPTWMCPSIPRRWISRRGWTCGSMTGGGLRPPQ